MLYPLYEYYLESNLSLEEITHHYIQNFYLKRYGRNRVDEIERRVKESSKVKSIYAESITQGVVPNCVDFGSAINEMLWFMFKSNVTQALAILIAAKEWERKVNSIYQIGTEQELRDKTIRIFRKYEIYEEMTQDEFETRASL